MRFLEGPPGFQGEGQKWVLIVGGALLSTLSNRLGYKLKQVLDTKQTNNSGNSLRGSGKSTDRKSRGARFFLQMHIVFPTTRMVATIIIQDQIAELQNTLDIQLLHSSHLQLLLDAANMDLFDSEREIQRLRKEIADHCVGHICQSPCSSSVASQGRREEWPCKWISQG
ncbi:uncharacterized protein LOC111397053 isoform X1 [Olea europaea var. sylvestris]|uniref:uncharacterized protein LOC111397053 isoform X1 n=1 Tax=Olea europaea var. sylvestris TaxID=158386 RepID=UPI000C1CD899|nr:uncharacterized protein LOC111397053 isoform X1 [Olea europaea var. sylvestris]XP_022879516.1 uncharacterized protein LOC111397053 isoform X1 [Olea europaea var. sylvestris]